MLARLSALFKNLAIYGLGDVATQILSFLLLPLYVHFLTPADYGVISLITTVEVVAKILFRWGVDASYMRLAYDCKTDLDRQRLTSTLFWFLTATNGVTLLVLLLAIRSVASHLFGAPGYALLLGLVLVNTFVIGFYFLPFHQLRIQERPRQFAALTTGRLFATLIARLLLIVVFQLGVLGFVLADIIVTAVFTLVLARWLRPLLRPMFSKTILIEALRFGLPRLPHGIAQQITAVGDRYILSLFTGLRDVGVYSIGASFGLALKLFLSAFETAWAPFYFGIMKEPDAKATFRVVTTYGVAVLVLLEAGLAAIATDLVRLMTRPEFYDAAAIIPWVGLGVLFNGVYLLTSIGLNITKSTKYYPVATGITAAVSVGANLLLVPRFGALGAAWSNAAAYATLAGVAFVLSQRVYPMRYEYGRVLRLIAAGLGAYLLTWLVPSTLPAWLGLLLRGSLVCAAYPALLLMLGFYHRRELAFVARLIAGARAKAATLAASGRAPAVREESVEAAGAIVEVPLAQDDEDPDVPGSGLHPAEPMAASPDTAGRPGLADQTGRRSAS